MLASSEFLHMLIALEEVEGRGREEEEGKGREGKRERKRKGGE
jgi:hypothetical protein